MSQGFPAAVARHKWLMTFFVLAGGGASMALFEKVPKKYKITAEVGVQSQCFQYGGLLPDPDLGQMRAEAEGSMKESLNHEYLLALGRKHGLFVKEGEGAADPADDAEPKAASYELEELRNKRFEILPVGPASLQIGFTHSNPEVGYQVLRETLARFRAHLNEKRRKKLDDLRDANLAEHNRLVFGGKGQPTTQAPAQILREKLRRTQEQIRQHLSSGLSDAHPSVAALRREADAFARKLGEKRPHGELSAKEANTILSCDGVDATLKELCQDRIKKIQQIEVLSHVDEQNRDSCISVLREPFIPKYPLSPKRPIFLMAGVVAGFLLAAFIAFVSEVRASGGDGNGDGGGHGGGPRSGPKVVDVPWP